VPLHSTLYHFADPEGVFLDHDAAEQAIDFHLGLPSFEAVDDARARTQSALRPGVPRDVRILTNSLELA
jgi:hypothetical protein